MLNFPNPIDGPQSPHPATLASPASAFPDVEVSFQDMFDNYRDDQAASDRLRNRVMAAQTPDDILHAVGSFLSYDGMEPVEILRDMIERGQRMLTPLGVEIERLQEAIGVLNERLIQEPNMATELKAMIDQLTELLQDQVDLMQSQTEEQVALGLSPSGTAAELTVLTSLL